jgi:hypothetical protein
MHRLKSLVPQEITLVALPERKLAFVSRIDQRRPLLNIPRSARRAVFGV